ncbi:hypothetical protein TRVL_01407 [Trypanosoma vivax]|nr:hypothetical protein TRVL_01407 [Trypanosoma vivax]
MLMSFLQTQVNAASRTLPPAAEAAVNPLNVQTDNVTIGIPIIVTSLALGANNADENAQQQAGSPRTAESEHGVHDDAYTTAQYIQHSQSDDGTQQTATEVQILRNM